MVYLVGPRLNFAGRFNADVATGNNTPGNYSGGAIDPEFNFTGSGSWWVNNVKITGATYADGSDASADPAIGILLTQQGRGRIVDLDPEQQLVSQIYGVQFDLVEALGEDSLFAGVFDVTNFRDIWWSRGAGQGDRSASASYQSELTGVNWGANSLQSRLLDELKTMSAAGRLSIRFVLDGFFAQGGLSGRIVGTIGAAVDGEPLHHVRGHHIGLISATNIPPSGSIWYFEVVVDRQRNKLIADVGKALETTTPGGPISISPQYEIGIASGGNFTSLGVIPAQGGDWYERTGGICEFPANRALTAAELQLLDNNPIVVVAANDHSQRVAFEDATGLHVTTDEQVFRLSAGEPAEAVLYATRFGLPAASEAIGLVFDSNGLQKFFPDAVADDLTFPNSVTTGSDGIARFTMTAGSVMTPRGGLDGQVCGIRWLFTQADPQLPIFIPDGFFSILVWTDYQVPADPNWVQHIEPILKQYGTLYPVMKNLAGGVDLAAYTSVVQRKQRMLDVMGLPLTDPRHMPVTRDLSPAKRQAIEAWLKTTGNNGQPNLGVGPGLLPLQNVVSAPDGKTNAMRVRRAPRLQ